MYQLVCHYPKCNKPFSHQRKTPQYCSRRCAYDDRIGKPRHPNAGKKRTKKPTRFTCEYCNEPFERMVYPTTKSVFEFCSPVCRNKARIIPDVPCPICGAMFRPRINDIGRHRKKHCSKECADTAKVGQESPKRTAKEIRDIIIELYPTCGAQHLAGILGKSKSSILAIANNLGVKLNPDVFREIVHEAARTNMIQNNPMFRDEVKEKVKAFWDSHPEEKKEHKRKFMEGHSQLRKDKPTKLEDKLCRILEELGIAFEPQAIIKDKFIVDIRIDSLIIQADGDYWHGHPRFEPLTDRQKAQQKRDKAQDKYLTTCGYTVIRIWESNMSYHLVESLLNRYRTS